MKTKSKIVLSALAGVIALAIFSEPGTALAQSLASSRLQALLPEMSQFCGQNGLQIEVRNPSNQDVHDRLVIVRRLDPLDLRLRDAAGNCVVTDFRVPASGTILVNGHSIPMVPGVHGGLSGSVHSQHVNWFSSNQIQVFVYDAQGAQIWEFGLTT